jgi:hypothetical protein
MALTLFSGEKGGVGKSTACKVYLDDHLARSGKDRIVVVEADTSNPDIHRLFQTYFPIECIDLRVHDGWMQLVDLLADHRDREVVVSLPAGIAHHLAIEAEFLLGALIETGHALTVYWLINRDKDSIILLRDFLTNPLADYAQQISVVMNGYFGEMAKFIRWNESKTRQDFLARPGCREAYLPELHERVVDAVTGPWSQAQGLRYSVTIELQRWLREARGALSVGGAA